MERAKRAWLSNGERVLFDRKGRIVQVRNEKNSDIQFENVESFISRGGAVRTPENSNLRKSSKSAVILRKSVKTEAKQAVEVDFAEVERFQRMQQVKIAHVEKSTVSNSDYTDTVR